MAVNVQRYAKRFEELIAKGKSYDEAHAQAVKESEISTSAAKTKPGRSKLAELIMGRRAYKSSVPKEKADVLKKAEEDIKKEKARENQYSRDVSVAGETKTDPQRKIEEIAKKARRTLLGMRK
ncbi:MAG: hypothetical protein IMZ61_03225 [Planctomycetes bacterium]|nr:hypothetical protein [Planctomycetota bacterium]